MAQYFTLEQGSLLLRFEITDSFQTLLLEVSPRGKQPLSVAEESKQWFTPVELQLTGDTTLQTTGYKHNGTKAGLQLEYDDREEYANNYGRKVEIHYTSSSGLYVTSHIQFYADTPVVRCWTQLDNRGAREVGLEYVSSFVYHGLAQGGKRPYYDKTTLWIPYSCWYGGCPLGGTAGQPGGPDPPAHPRTGVLWPQLQPLFLRQPRQLEQLRLPAHGN